MRHQVEASSFAGVDVRQRGGRVRGYRLHVHEVGALDAVEEAVAGARRGGGQRRRVHHVHALEDYGR